MALARISITLARELLTAADRCAKQLQRSRSWVVAEALRRFVAEAKATEPPVDASREIAEARRQLLAQDQSLSPTERLRRSEELAGLARRFQKRGRRQQVIAFETYDDYYEWKKGWRIGL